MEEAIINEREKGAVRQKLRDLQIAIFGNGTAIGLEQRVRVLEDRVRVENCLGMRALKDYFDEQEKKRKFGLDKVMTFLTAAMVLIMMLDRFLG